MVQITLIALLVGALGVASSPINQVTDTEGKLPIIDFTYAKHQATINETGSYYNFSNIRYGASPTGDLRFAAPIPPTTVVTALNDGQQGAICANSVPYWQSITAAHLKGSTAAQLEGIEETLTATEAALTISNLTAPDSRTSEDCLFLDVIVPTIIYNSNTLKSPVLVWIYGGGYVNGDKTSWGNGAGLVARSFEDSGEGVILVSMNYRTGLFGFLSGPSFNDDGGIPNAGLLDQRLALEWVQKYIHLFNGDPTRVTVMGESAGAGSIMHHITAWGNSTKPPFAQAIIQSPGFGPIIDGDQQDAIYQSVITQAQQLIGSDISGLDDLKKASYSDLVGLNTIVTARAPTYGTYIFGPAVSGDYVPALPSTLLLSGKFDPSTRIMTAHNLDEGALFTSPFITDEAKLFNNLATILPSIGNDTLNEILDTVYPAVYDGTYPYVNIFGRASLLTAELSFTCNNRYLNVAFHNVTYSYYFTVPPGYHAADVPYTFFNGDTTTLDDGVAVNGTLAVILQKILTHFAMESADIAEITSWPNYGSDATVFTVGNTDFGQLQKDPTANSRCTYWQKMFSSKDLIWGS